MNGRDYGVRWPSSVHKIPQLNNIWIIFDKNINKKLNLDLLIAIPHKYHKEIEVNRKYNINNSAFFSQPECPLQVFGVFEWDVFKKIKLYVTPRSKRRCWRFILWNVMIHSLAGFTIRRLLLHMSTICPSISRWRFETMVILRGEGVNQNMINCHSLSVWYTAACCVILLTLSVEHQ